MSSPTRLVIVSGLSGAGRTTAMKALEDLGFYCVDNLPVVLLENFVDLFSEGASQLAVAVDVREGSFLERFPDAWARLRDRGVPIELLFLDASDEILARRFNETRRLHPTRGTGTLVGDINAERELLAPVAALAGATVDTSDMSVHELKRWVTRHFSGAERSARLELEVTSFGYRYGLPERADLLIDVRFLPNPNFEPTLRERTGQDPEVAAWVLDRPQTRAFLQRFFDFIDYLLPLYETEGKAHLSIAVGCTGGQHRSVAIAEALEGHLRERKLDVSVTHRDAERRRRSEM